MTPELIDFCDAMTLSSCAVAWTMWRAQCYRCTRVIDGDSIVVKAYPWERIFAPDKPKEHVLRLSGIDTPERGQKGYTDAKEAMQKQVQGKLVRVEWQGRGKYGRHLAVVWRRGKNINRWMLKKGYASEYA